jgi:hypothetical protein
LQGEECEREENMRTEGRKRNNRWNRQEQDQAMKRVSDKETPSERWGKERGGVHQELEETTVREKKENTFAAQSSLLTEADS